MSANHQADALIEREILRRDDVGSVIVYFSDGRPVHAGRYQNDRVTSRWGIGYLWEHGIWEVPSSYGDQYQLFGLPTRRMLEREFREYFAELPAAGEPPTNVSEDQLTGTMMQISQVVARQFNKQE